MKTKKLTMTAAGILACAAVILGGTTAAQAAQLSTHRTSVSAAAEASPSAAGVPTGVTVATSSASCSGGRCWILFSNAETAALGRGSVPAPPSWVPGQIKVAYYAFAYVHRFIAADYARRGLCSAFILSIYPWEGRGYTSYRC